MLEGGRTWLEPCLSNEKEAIATTFASLADKGKAGLVRPLKVCMQDFDMALMRVHATVSPKDLETYVQFSSQFGEQG